MDQFVASLVQAVGVAYHNNPKRRANLHRSRVFHRRAPPPNANTQNRFRLRPCRVVGVMDADSFEVQVYQLEQQYAHTKGKPTVVVDPKGLVVSVSHEAKALDVKRLRHVNVARNMCRRRNVELQVIEKKSKFLKPEVKTKFITFQLRHELMKAVEELANTLGLQIGEGKDIEVALEGSDEFFIDLTRIVTKIVMKARDQVPNTPFMCPAGEEETYDWRNRPLKDIYLQSKTGCVTAPQFYRLLNQLAASRFGPYASCFRLSVGGVIIAKLCETLLDKTKIVCSGGIGTSEPLSKLACKKHKPNSVTVLTKPGFYRLAPETDFTDIPGFGGNLGNELKDRLKISTLSGLHFHLTDRNACQGLFPFLERKYQEKPGTIEKLAHGIAVERFKHKMMTNKVNCAKRQLNICNIPEFKKELNILCQNLIATLLIESKFNKRIPVKVSFEYELGQPAFIANTRFRKRSFNVNRPNFSMNPFGCLKEFWRHVVQTTVTLRKQVFENDLALRIISLNFKVQEFKQIEPLAHCYFIQSVEVLERPLVAAVRLAGMRVARRDEVSDEDEFSDDDDDETLESWIDSF